MMNRKVIVVTGLVAVALGVYLFVTSLDSSVLNKADVANIKQLVHDYSVGNIKAESASITSRQLIVTNADTSKQIYDLPKDEFFISIAPYIEHTHPCADHSLTSCRGELADKEFKVHIEDMHGNVILDQMMKSQSNGFIDFWLPRNETYRVTIAHDGKSLVSEISTYEGDNTCMTTMKLTDNKST